MLLSFLSKEPVVVILPTTISAFILTNGDKGHKSPPWRRALYAAAPLLAALAYLALFPAIIHRQASADSAGQWTAAAIGDRLFYYSGYLSSGLSLLLVIPAVYIILKRLSTSLRIRAGCPVLVILSFVIAMSIAKLHWYPFALVTILIAGLLLPKRFWFLLVWVFVPFAGLCVFLDVIRSYLYELAFGLSILSAVFANEMAGDFLEFWRARIKWPVVTYATVAVLIVTTSVLALPQVRKQTELMKLRSAVTMNSKYIMPYVKSLPHGSVLIMIDYPSMGIDFRRDMIKWNDREKLLLQSPLNCQGTLALGRWLKFIGRPDLVLIDYRTYSGDRDHYGSLGRVFVWSMTPRDRAFVRDVGLTGRVYAEVGAGDARMALIQLGHDGAR